ncbi:hypothetical protein Bca4012_103693 [Brassica carinata]|uniref:Uncharacterized protein n=1 Tax=Brassica carinata TaxID=52824 RepID=A0A8X7WL12_BRACI|nr:hypothetical protein Bca52824_002841 [Brassica carinata]
MIYLLVASRGLCDGLPETSFGNCVITEILDIDIPKMVFGGYLKSFDERSCSGKCLKHLFLKNNHETKSMVKGDSFDIKTTLRAEFPMFKRVISLEEKLEQYVDAVNMIICSDSFTTPHSFRFVLKVQVYEVFHFPRPPELLCNKMWAKVYGFLKYGQRICKVR